MAKAMIIKGMKAECLELGEASEVIRPAKNISSMEDMELESYIDLLEVYIAGSATLPRVSLF